MRSSVPKRRRKRPIAKVNTELQATIRKEAELAKTLIAEGVLNRSKMTLRRAWRSCDNIIHLTDLLLT